LLEIISVTGTGVFKYSGFSLFIVNPKEVVVMLTFSFQDDLLICKNCDRGVHLPCLNMPPDNRPKVWDCDDCQASSGGKLTNNNIKKLSQYD